MPKSNLALPRAKFRTRIILVGRHLWRSFSPASSSAQIPPDQVAQGLVVSKSQTTKDVGLPLSLLQCFMIFSGILFPLVPNQLLPRSSEQSLGPSSLQPSSATWRHWCSPSLPKEPGSCRASLHLQPLPIQAVHSPAPLLPSASTLAQQQSTSLKSLSNMNIITGDWGHKFKAGWLKLAFQTRILYHLKADPVLSAAERL